MKRRCTDWEKLFSEYASDKELIFQMHKELLKLSNRKTNNLIKKAGERSKQTLSDKRYTVGR